MKTMKEHVIQYLRYGVWYWLGIACSVVMSMGIWAGATDLAGTFGHFAVCVGVGIAVWLLGSLYCSILDEERRQTRYSGYERQLRELGHRK
ncbi:MAG: hypothetical protein Q4B15_07905 [Lachnospiraceae bacterium]|nr:hypothetical protein [Lachnospiraceae bacterium]